MPAEAKLCLLLALLLIGSALLRIVAAVALVLVGAALAGAALE